jgi:membrane-bound serine protease (ClpP class)
LVGLALWLLPNARLGGFLTLNTRLVGDGRSQPATATAGTGAGGGGPPESVDPAKAKLVSSLEHLDGQHGVALSDLRPAGVARFGKARVDVVTEGDFVARGTPIEVLRVEGNRVTVRAVETD